jgi:hypothetical protein
MVNIEEAEKSTYKTNVLGTRIKQLTTMNTCARGMYSESTSSRNWAMFSMNTNSEDLYGLTRNDNALISRLVILNFKQNRMSKKEMNDICQSFISNKDFAYSLYHYLAFDRIIRSDFSPVRYDGKDKFDFINKAKSNNKNSVEEWFTNSHEDIFEKRKYKGEIYMCNSKSYLNQIYSNYKDNHKNDYNVKKIDDFMNEKGFQLVKTTFNEKPGIYVYRMTLDKFNELIEELNNDSVETLDEIEEYVN